MANRILIIANANSGRYSQCKVACVFEALSRAGVVVDVIQATSPAAIGEAARNADVDGIVVAGGDGSVNAAVAGLLRRTGARPALGVIAAGTANVLAYELGLPDSARELAELFSRGPTRLLHLGLANGAPFVLMASAGFDAQVVEAVEAGPKRLLGRLAYVYCLVKVLVQSGSHSVEVDTGDRVFVSKLAIVTKARCYGGKFELDPGMSVLSPGLKLVAVTKIAPSSIAALASMLLFGRLRKSDFIEIIPVTRVDFRSTQGAATQVDGDFHGPTPMTVAECPETIEVFCPCG